MRLTLLLLVLLSFINMRLSACFILSWSDGDRALVGNHEDWFANDAAIKIIPPDRDAYGSVIFTFESECWAQGGMNEKGLFFDGAYTPFQEVTFPSHTVKHPGYIWQEMLDKCATVKEALIFLQRYKLTELQKVHIVIADALGNAALLGVREGQLAIKERTSEYLMQTNFNPWHPELSDEPTCQRYNTGEKILGMRTQVSQENMLEVLKQTHQDSLTVYSNIYDLKAKSITTYYQTKFDRPITISLPEIFRKGICMVSLSELTKDFAVMETCSNRIETYELNGRVLDGETREPVPYANIGILDKNLGTLSDPDGTFSISVPAQYADDTLLFSSLGYAISKYRVADLNSRTIYLTPNSIVLDEISVVGKTSFKKARLGWMKGKDGIVPFDTVQGGGAVALLIEAPSAPVWVNKVQLRLLYNSKDTSRFRLRFYSYDSLTGAPGAELLNKDVILRENRRFGWMRFDLLSHDIFINERKVFVGFEWLDERRSREQFLAGLAKWEAWKKSEYEKGNSKVEFIARKGDSTSGYYKYHGNMMNWPGFHELPPWTSLMVQSGKNERTKALKTFERKTSFGEWKEKDSTLNAVVQISY
ncbi:MAG: carboxypeptidase-like regulatory domain-containing protein [Bacteroidota bacterium]